MAENWEAVLAAHLRFEHGLSYQKIAKRLKRPEQVIKGWIAYYLAEQAAEEARHD